MKKERGFLLLAVLIFLTLLTLLVLASVERAVLERKMVQQFKSGITRRQGSDTG